MSTLSAERKSLDADLSNEAAAENVIATFACGITLNVRGYRKLGRQVILSTRASGCFWTSKKNPHEMGLEKGNVSRDRPKVIRQAETPACAHTAGLSILTPMTFGQNLQLARW
jgi:hypothetical protein